ncbi:putative drug resistance transporter [Rhodococcus wratislaviensis NBRC 100605]|uniref:Putative drug resistance transporter n=1 Tax=Rhodococcus wratislaviensis NBRC 100605 TaxID=1219028 RepID=X0QF69_RHOWR|nr:putative drug resistance transporter [Rhodococcus wratislaviensis NBRC 100605]
MRRGSLVQKEAFESHPLRSGTPARRTLGFVAAASSLALIFVGSGSAIPQFENYRTLGNLTLLHISIAATGYTVAVMTVLLVFGRVSDFVGRRTVTVVALCAAAAGCCLLLGVTGLSMLLLGRMLQGLSCGLASSAIGAFVIDLAPRRRAWIAPAVAMGAPLVGLAGGALLAGGLVEFGPRPQQTPYLVVIALLGLALILVLLSAEPVMPRPGAWRSMRPRIRIPRAARAQLPVALPVFCATWAMSGFYLSFSPSIAAQSLGTSNALVAAVLFSSYMVLFPVGSIAAGRLVPSTAQKLGITCFATGAVGVASGLLLGHIALVLGFGMVAGAGQGLATTGAMTALLAVTKSPERTGLLSAIYMISYTGAAVPNVVAGAVAGTFSLAEIAVAYAALAVVAFLCVLNAGNRSGTGAGFGPRPGRGLRPVDAAAGAPDNVRGIE